MSSEDRRFGTPRSRAAVMAAALAMSTGGAALAEERGDGTQAAEATADERGADERATDEEGATEGEAEEDSALETCIPGTCTVPLYGVMPLDPSIPPLSPSGGDDDDDDEESTSGQEDEEAEQDRRTRR